MATLTGDPCAALAALAQFQLDVLRKLNRKFDQLQRLAELLEQLGDVTTLIPNISALIPVSQINVATYIQLQQSCPFLGLPPVSEGSLDELKNRVVAAYESMIGKLLNHPFSRLDKVQGYLKNFQTDINAGGAVIGDYLTCLLAICNTVGQAGTLFDKITSSDINKEVSSYAKNFVQNGGEVLSAGAKLKAAQVNTTVTQLRALQTLN